MNLKSKYFFCIYPTAPLLKVNDIKKAYKKIKKIKYDGLIATCKYSSSPFRAFIKKKSDKINYLNKKYAFKRSQDLKETFYDTGTFYIFRSNKYLKSKGKLMDRTTFYNIDRNSSADINTLEDFKFAEFLNKFKLN